MTFDSDTDTRHCNATNTNNATWHS